MVQAFLLIRVAAVVALVAIYMAVRDGSILGPTLPFILLAGLGLLVATFAFRVNCGVVRSSFSVHVLSSLAVVSQGFGVLACTE